MPTSISMSNNTDSLIPRIPSEKSFLKKKFDFEIYIYSDRPCHQLKPGIICFAKTCILLLFSDQFFSEDV